MKDSWRIGHLYRDTASWSRPEDEFLRRLRSGHKTLANNDIRIFGRARAVRYVPGLDDATAGDIRLRPFKRVWSRYIRVEQARFVAGTLANCISLNELMAELGSHAFASTQRNAANGSGNTDPRMAFMQQAAVQLSDKGLAWLRKRLDASFRKWGEVPRGELDKLDGPIPSPKRTTGRGQRSFSS